MERAGTINETIAQGIIKMIADGETSIPQNYEKERASWINEELGSLTGYDCPECKNRGYVADIKDNCVVTRECRCMSYRRSMRNIEKSGLSGLVDDYTFDRYTATEPWQKRAKAMAIEYLNDTEGNWFCALGAVGSGKTHLCTAICVELLKAGKEVNYMLWRDEAVKLKSSINDTETYQKVINPLKKVEALYIDDFFKTERDARPTAGDVNLAFELLNYRYNNKKLITVISSERGIKNFLDIDEGVGSRIYQRSKKYCLELSGTGKNQRLKVDGAT